MKEDMNELEYDEEAEILEGVISLEAPKEYYEDKEIEANVVIESETGNITEAQKSAYEYIKKEFKSIYDKILELVYKDSNEDGDYQIYDEETDDYESIEFDSKEEVNNMIEIMNVHISNVEHKGFAYIGLEFSCDWDEEHGFGVLLYKNRIVDFGGADVSFLGWNAEDDKEKMEKEEQ